MKKIIFSILILILMNSAFAMNVEAPTEIPKNVNWLLKAELDSENDYDTAEVFLDGDRVVTMYVLPDGSGLIDSFDESVVLKAFVQDEGNLVLYVSFLGVSEGNHDLRVKELQNGSVFDEKLVEINTFGVLPESYKTEIQEKMDNIDNWSDRMSDRVSELDTLIESKNSEISNLQSEINTLRETNTSLESEVANLKSDFAGLQNEMNATAGDLENLYIDFSLIQEILNDQAERGLLSFIFPKTKEPEVIPETITEETTEETVMNENPTMFAVLPEVDSSILIGAVIVIVLIAAFLFIKSRGVGSGSFYSDTEFIGMDDESGSPGKWAFSGEEIEIDADKPETPSAPKTGKRFHISDLLKKD